MRRVLAGVVLGVAAGVALAEKPTATGHLSESGKYSVVFPAKPTKVDWDKTVATAVGNLTVVTTKCETGSIVYSVTYTDYPDSFKEVEPTRVIDGVATGMKGTDGQLGDESNLEVEGGAGKSFSVTAGENVVRAKVMLVKQRLYLVQVSGRKGDVRGKMADEFLSSFHVGK